MALNMINRTNVEGLIPVQTVNEIIQNLPTESIFLSLARPLPRMTSKQQKVPVLTGLANASFPSRRPCFPMRTMIFGLRSARA